MPVLRRPATIVMSLCAAFVAMAATATPAVAGWQPGDRPLNGLQFYGANNVEEPGWSASISCTPLGDGRARVEFSGTAPSSDSEGPYVGPATISGSLIISNATGSGSGSDLQGEFSIESPSRVSGTFSGGEDLDVRAACDRATPYVSFNVYRASYAAQVAGPSRTWSDTGGFSLSVNASCPEPASCGDEADRRYIGGSLESSHSAPEHIWATPRSGTILIGATDELTATVQGADGSTPKEGVTVRFEQRFGDQEEFRSIGSCITDGAGECRLRYEGPSQAATATVAAYFDADLSGTFTRGDRWAPDLLTRTWIASGVGDADGDGVEDPIDPGGPSEWWFVDDSTTPVTSGTVFERHPLVDIHVSDAPGADGVRIKVGAPDADADSVGVQACGYRLYLKPGTDVVVTCGSVLLRVISGQVTVSLPEVATTVTVPAGVTAKVHDAGADGTYPVENLGGGSLTVTAGGTATTVPAGSSWGLPAWRWEGFFAPVDNDGIVNTLKAGRVVPLKWRLLEADGTPVLGLTSVKVTVEGLTCESGTTLDALEEVAAGASGLQELGDGLYQFNWATPKSYANSCKRLRLDVGDGTPHEALFRFLR